MGELFAGGKGGGGAGASRVQQGTELPDLETQEGLKMLQRKDEEIDQGLDMIAEGVQDLNNLALDMKDEVKTQAAMIDEITTKVDDASKHLTGLNKRMKKTLQ